MLRDPVRWLPTPAEIRAECRLIRIAKNEWTDESDTFSVLMPETVPYDQRYGVPGEADDGMIVHESDPADDGWGT